MSAADTVARILTLVPWLLERPGASVDEAAAAFGVDRATILGDLDTVGYCGMPGLGGGDLFEISIVGDRVVVEMAQSFEEPLRLTAREALRLVLAGEAVAAALGEQLPALRSALAKVRDAAGIPPGVRVELEDDGSHWLPVLRDAIDAGRRVAMTYRSRGEPAPGRRTLDPWGLEVFEGAWYVHGRDGRSGEPRTFRIDRIADLDILDEEAEPPPPGASPPRPGYEAGPGDIRVVLHLAPDARWVADAVRGGEVSDDRARVAFRTDAPGWVVRLALAAAPGVTVVEPPQLAGAVRREATKALDRYEATSGRANRLG